MNTALYLSLSLCPPLLLCSFYLLPSRLIPWATHFLRRQLWQRFLLARSMRQLLCLEQEYCTLEDWLLRKKPYRVKDWVSGAVNKICSFKVQHYALNYRCRISMINQSFHLAALTGDDPIVHPWWLVPTDLTGNHFNMSCTHTNAHKFSQDCCTWSQLPLPSLIVMAKGLYGSTVGLPFILSFRKRFLLPH